MSAPAAKESSQGGLAPLWVGLAIWLFFPLGLFLLWRHPTLGKNGKWWAAGIAWACFIMFMGSRVEKVPESQAEQSSEDSSGSAVASKPARKSRKKPVMKAPPFPDKPERVAAYKEGWEQGVAKGHEWLDEIDAKAKGANAAEFLKTNPELSAAIEQQRFALLNKIGDMGMETGRVVTALVESGVTRKTIERHPQYLEAEARAQFAVGESRGFNAVVDPLLSAK